MRAAVSTFGVEIEHHDALFAQLILPIAYSSPNLNACGALIFLPLILGIRISSLNAFCTVNAEVIIKIVSILSTSRICSRHFQKKRKREETVGRKFAIILFILKLINVFSSIFQLSVHLLRVLNTYQILTGSKRPKSNRSDIGITR